MKFTTRSIAALTLPAGKADHLAFDDDVPGLGIRLREGGSRVWVFQYRVGPKQRRMALGSVAAIPLAKARELAGDLQAKIRLGGDPAAEKTQSRARAAETFAAVLPRFLAGQRVRLRNASYREVERHLLVQGKSFHPLPITSIDRRAIAIRLGAIAEASGPTAANRARTSLSTFFSWLIREGVLDANPVNDTNVQAERSRDRVLSEFELAAIWNNLTGHDYADVVRLLMLTGQRPGEIGGLLWSEVLDEQIILPAERTKNKRLHTVPLSDLARAILAKRERTRDLVFGFGQGGFNGWHKAKEALEVRIAKQTGRPLASWIHHDIRRSVATHMAEIGVAPHIIEAVLNHVSGHKAGVAGIYNRSTYDREKRIALDLWAEHLLATVEGREKNVTPLKRA